MTGGLHCGRCGAAITREQWRLAIDDRHRHGAVDAQGRPVGIRCFAAAPGALTQGLARLGSSHFHGFAWRVSRCRGCGGQLGWRYEGADAPGLFFGLIAEALVARPPAAPVEL